jgi:hypothetical protein
MLRKSQSKFSIKLNLYSNFKFILKTINNIFILIKIYFLNIY